MKTHPKNILATLTIFGGLCLLQSALAAGGGAILSDPGAMQGKHFDSKGKMPSQFTIELQQGLRKTLPFEDKRDAEEAKK